MIPTADYVFIRGRKDWSRAYEFMQARDFHIVVKADFPCAGKGVFICKSPEEIRLAIIEIGKLRLKYYQAA